MFNPVQRLGRGLFIPPTLLQHSKNAPPVFPEVKRLHYGYLVISPSKTVQLVHSYPNHMLHVAWQPSAGTFGAPCGAPPVLPSASRLAGAPEGSHHRLQECGLDQLHQPSVPLVLECPCYFARDTEERLCLSAGAAIFATPSDLATFARGRSPTHGRKIKKS